MNEVPNNRVLSKGLASFGGFTSYNSLVGRDLKDLKDLVPTPQHRQGFLPSPSSKASDSEGID